MDNNKITEEIVKKNIVKQANLQASIAAANSGNTPAALPGSNNGEQGQTNDPAVSAIMSAGEAVVSPVINNALLDGNAGNPGGDATLLKGYVEAWRTNANSNQEEYQTVARTEGTEKMQIAAALLGADSWYLDAARRDASSYGASIIEYSKNAGGMASLSNRADALAGELGVNANVLFTSGETLVNDALKNRDVELADKIGSFSEKALQAQTDERILKFGAGANINTLNSLDRMRTGNYRALNEKFNLTDKYNKVASASGLAIIRADEFKGTKEQIDAMRNVLSGADLANLEECVSANGFGFTSEMMRAGREGDMARNGRARLLNKSMESTQSAGFNAIKNGANVGVKGVKVATKIADKMSVASANKEVKRVDKLLKEQSKLADAGRHADPTKVNKKLDKIKNKYGLDGAASAKDLKDKVALNQKLARDAKATRKEMQSLRGMSKKEKRAQLNRIRREKLLNKKDTPLSRLREKALSSKYARLISKIKVGRVGNVLRKLNKYNPFAVIGRVKSFLFKKFLQPLLKMILSPKVLAGLGIAVVSAYLMAVVVAGVMAVIYRGEDADGTDKPVIQVVNEYMNDFEASELESLEGDMKRLIVADYDPMGYRQSLKDIGYNPLPEVDVNGTYKIWDEYGKSASICNCMQCMSLYRYYYIIAEGDDSDEMVDDNEFWQNNFKNKMKQIWQKTHYVKSSGNAFGGTKNRLWDRAKLTMDDFEISGRLGTGFHNAGGAYVYHNDADLGDCDNKAIIGYIDTPITETTTDEDGNEVVAVVGTHRDYITGCAGHVNATAHVVTETDIKTIAVGNKLEGHFGKNIQYKNFTDEELEEMADLIGTYEDNYAEGYETYTDMEVYFGATKALLSSEDIEDLLDKLKAKWGGLTKREEAYIRTAMSGCGKFNYSMDAHGNCGTGVTGGLTDCSGYMSWVHNNCGLYTNEVSFATSGWKSYGKSWNHDLKDVRPGTLFVLGDRAVSDGGVNHIVMWLGYYDGEPYIIDCTSSTPGSSLRVDNTISTYKWMIPAGSCSVW